MLTVVCTPYSSFSKSFFRITKNIKDNRETTATTATPAKYIYVPKIIEVYS
ncbi:MAG TPA: hypothetical protein PK600_01490 [Deltaproteobacteria bacterium]|nr:hypothetical protein [Deltaproteobacteria bacterium]